MTKLEEKLLQLGYDIKPYTYIKNELDLKKQSQALACLQDELEMLKGNIELCQD